MEYDNTREWFYTNLAHALLFQNKYEDAIKINVEMKDKTCTFSDDYATFSEVFLCNLKELQEAGITHPDIEKMKSFLNE